MNKEMKEVGVGRCELMFQLRTVPAVAVLGSTLDGMMEEYCERLERYSEGMYWESDGEYVLLRIRHGCCFDGWLCCTH